VRDTGSYFLQTINNGCTSLISDPIKVKFLTSPKAIIAGDSIVNLCGQDSIALTSQDLADNYIWNDSVYSKQRWVYETGFYSLRTILNGCTSSISKPVYVDIIPKPEILFDGDTIIESGGFTVINLLNKRYKYNWYPGLGLNDSLSPNPIIRPLVTTTYLVRAKSSDSCTNIKRITIKVVNSYSIPNIITPNGDGVNDVWILPVNEFSNVEFEIYNRWGMKVHSENMYHNSWNGSNLPEGLYYFSLTMTKELEQKKIKGWLQIINSTN
jgi:gliding motility-associated-like protein